MDSDAIRVIVPCSKGQWSDGEMVDPLLTLGTFLGVHGHSDVTDFGAGTYPDLVLRDEARTGATGFLAFPD